ncbi:unnamed protein product [Trichobilharzia regenti]|nr:unnamed protein product [Trichobilharzia regenti]
MLEKFIFFLFLSTIITIDESNQQYGIIPECKLDGLEQTILWSTAADFSRIQSPKMINIWPGERINLTHHIMHKSNLSKIWLWQTGENFKTGYRLQETVECFTMKREIQYNPYREIYNLLIHKDGIYALAFKEVDWQANIEKGLHETYIPLAIYTVSVLKPASIGYTLRLIAYHSDDQCYDIQHKTEWIFQALSKNKLESKENTKLLNSKFEYKTLETRCSQLPNDDSPIQMIYYYNINRLKVTPNGYTPASERPWKLITSYKSYVIKESLLINLPREFGMAKRIRLENIQVPFGDGLKITLKSISDEGVSEGLWGLGHVTPPFSDDRILHQIYAVVKLNSSLYDLLREKPDELNIQWILIEPIYGRLRTSSGITVQMNQYYHWTNAQYLTQLEINHLKSKDVSEY